MCSPTLKDSEAALPQQSSKRPSERIPDGATNQTSTETNTGADADVDADPQPPSSRSSSPLITFSPIRSSSNNQAGHVSTPTPAPKESSSLPQTPRASLIHFFAQEDLPYSTGMDGRQPSTPRKKNPRHLVAPGVGGDGSPVSRGVNKDLAGDAFHVLSADGKGKGKGVDEERLTGEE